MSAITVMWIVALFAAVGGILGWTIGTYVTRRKIRRGP